MTHANAIRWLAHQAKTCRDRDSSEAFCLLLPALLRILELEPMEEVEAAAFRYEFKLKLATLPFEDATDRAAQARPAVLARAMQPPKTHEFATTGNGRSGAQAGCVRQAPAPS